MSSDGRYIYPHPTGMTSSYDYHSYPPASYEPGQMSQPPRPIRSHSSQSQSPHQPPSFNPPHSPYQYAPNTYSMHPPPPPPPQQPAQWADGNWNHYNQSFPPAQMQEVGFNSGPGRPDAQPSLSPEQRGYPPNDASPDSRRPEERPITQSSAPPSQSRSRRREKSPTSALPGTPPGLDFIKLLESYRFIIDGAQSFSNAPTAPGRPLPAEAMERMLQSATYGAQMLESATMPPASPESRIAADKQVEDTKGSPNNNIPTKRPKPEDSSAQEGQMCLGCNVTSTPEWRRGPMGPRTLCNACGLVYAKMIKKRVRESGRAYRSGGSSQGGTGSHNPEEDGLASSGEGGSDDEESYGSQDQRSDGRG